LVKGVNCTVKRGNVLICTLNKTFRFLFFTRRNAASCAHQV